jgi:lysophospholipase L1-like esterase
MPVFRLTSWLVLLAVVLSPWPRLRAQESATSPSRWEAAIRKFEAEDAERPPAPGGVLFVGSSSIRLWDLQASFPDLHALNRGFGGSQLADVAELADRVVLPYKPRQVVVYAGDNDIAAGKSPEQVVAAYQKLVEKIHAQLPETRIVFVSIKPSLKRWALIEPIRHANRSIAEIAAKDKRLEFVDIEPPMLGPDGLPRKELFRDDGLHLNAEGYKVWAERLRPVLERLTKPLSPLAPRKDVLSRSESRLWFCPSLLEETSALLPAAGSTP